jgi:hypothetical protein
MSKFGNLKYEENKKNGAKSGKLRGTQQSFGITDPEIPSRLKTTASN